MDFGDPNRILLVHCDEDQGEDARLLDHPMALNCEEKFREEILANPELLSESDERGWTLLHNEALAGNRNIVRILLEGGADPSVRTNAGQTPRDLARVLGWDDNVALLGD